MTIFKKHNLRIALGFINDNEPTYCNGFIDPNDPIFNTPLNKL